MTIAKLFARIGLKVDEEKLNKLTKDLEKIKTGMIIAATSATAFSLAIRKITDEAMEAAVAFKQFEAETGASTDELQKWQAVANQTNNSAEAVASSIKAITANQEKIKLGQGNISGYQLLGIDPRQDPFEILEQLKEKTAGLAPAMKKNVLQQIGVSTDLIQVLELTNDEFDRMAANAFIIPRSSIESIDRMRQSVKVLSDGLRYMKSRITAELAPSITKLSKQLTVWIKQNEDGVIKTIKQIFYWITKFATAITRTASMINQGVNATIGWGNALKILIGIFAFLNASLLASPLGLIIAGLVLLVAIMDDLYVYSKGEGESLFGNMMKQFPELEKILNGLKTAFEGVGAVLQLLFTGDVEPLKEWLDQFEWWRDLVDDIKEGIQAIKDLLSGDKTLKEIFTGGGAGSPEGAPPSQFAQDYLSNINAPGLVGSRQNNTTINNNTKVDIETSADAQETYNIFNLQTQRMYNSAASNRRNAE